jgi:hypothetical protein
MYNRKRRGIGKGVSVHGNADFFDAAHIIRWIPDDDWKFDGEGTTPGGDIHGLADAGCGACDPIGRGDFESRFLAADLSGQTICSTGDGSLQSANCHESA